MASSDVRVTAPARCALVAVPARADIEQSAIDLASLVTNRLLDVHVLHEHVYARLNIMPDNADSARLIVSDRIELVLVRVAHRLEQRQAFIEHTTYVPSLELKHLSALSLLPMK
ncbi:hypothetical protein HD806DRAFT_533461 [Xylariaceae sp. AK1471]|nr:hypothetical protein HD806DRAFT_533461 [Xylariaceae sp. AK1471]